MYTQKELDSIVFGSDTVRYVFREDKNYLDMTIGKNSMRLKRTKPLGSGTYCAVYEYNELGNRKLAYAVRNCTDEAVDESKMSVLLNNLPYTVKQKEISTNVYIMQLMEGDLEQLFRTRDFTDAEKLCIVEQARQLLVGLADNGFFYTDVNMGNFLYKYEKYVLKILLGDIGSMMTNKNGDMIATFPPPETWIPSPGYISSRWYRNSDAMMRMMSWFVGILLAHILEEDNTLVYGFVYDHIRIREYHKKREALLDKYPLYLNNNPWRRRDVHVPLCTYFDIEKNFATPLVRKRKRTLRAQVTTLKF